MRVIISGGGTGGHIFPAVAIANVIKKNNPESEILYIGSAESMESDLIPKENIAFKTVRTGYITRNIFSFSNIITLINNIIGIIQSVLIMVKFKPDIVIGTGGFVSGPVLAAGWICRKKCIIHEQNIYPGITNRILSRIADRIMISFNDSAKYFRNKDRIFLTGNPVRETVLSTDTDTARKHFGIKDEEFFIYSFGGSGGQRSLNNAMLGVFDRISENKNIRILHVYGRRLEKEFMQKYNKKYINVQVTDYMYESHMALAAADLIISSAGAITIAEITSIGKPSILIPKSSTAENHQEKNAVSMSEKGAAVVITEKELNAKLLSEKINLIYSDKDYRTLLKNNSALAGTEDSKGKIYEVISSVMENDNENERL